jgi:hypothetical protein
MLGGGMLAGCSDDDTVAPVTTDAGGVDQTSPPVDAGVDSAVDAGDSAGIILGKALLVHASPDFPPFRVCFAVRVGTFDSVAPLPALPDEAPPALGLPYPGIFPGTGGPLPAIKDLSQDVVTPYLVLADKIKTQIKSDGGTQLKCTDLVETDAGTALVEGVDYYKFPAIPAGTFLQNHTALIGLTGCFPLAKDPNATAAKCGADYDATSGNLAIKLQYLDKTPVAATAMGAQFVHFSQPLQTAVAPGVIPVLINGTTTTPISAAPVTFGKIGPATANAMANVNASTTAFGIAAPQADGGIGPVLGSAILPLVEGATLGPGGPADYFKNGANYTFVVVGDPAIPAVDDAGTFNGFGLHFLGFSNDPFIPKL